jgi:hypothetical protein
MLLLHNTHLLQLSRGAGDTLSHRGIDGVDGVSQLSIKRVGAARISVSNPSSPQRGFFSPLSLYQNPSLDSRIPVEGHESRRVLEARQSQQLVQNATTASQDSSDAADMSQQLWSRLQLGQDAASCNKGPSQKQEAAEAAVEVEDAALALCERASAQTDYGTYRVITAADVRAAARASSPACWDSLVADLLGQLQRTPHAPTSSAAISAVIIEACRL